MTHDYFSAKIGRIPKLPAQTISEAFSKSRAESAKRAWDNDAKQRRDGRLSSSANRVAKLRREFITRGAKQDRDLIGLGLSERQCDALGRAIEAFDDVSAAGGPAWKVAEQSAAIMLVRRGVEFADLLTIAESGRLQREAMRSGASPAVLPSPTAITVKPAPKVYVEDIQFEVQIDMHHSRCRSVVLDALRDGASLAGYAASPSDQGVVSPEVVTIAYDAYGARSDTYLLSRKDGQHDDYPDMLSRFVDPTGAEWAVIEIRTQCGDRRHVEVVLRCISRPPTLKASGGPVSPGNWGLVGERGPEAMLPRDPNAPKAGTATFMADRRYSDFRSRD